MNKQINHVLQVREWVHNEYVGFEVVELWRESEDRSWYTSTWFKRNEHGDCTYGVKLYCQRNRYTSPNEEHLAKMYAFNVSPVDVPNNWMGGNADKIESHIKRIRKIEKAYNAHCQRFGNTSTFSQFCFVIGSILKVDAIISGGMDGENVNELSFDELLTWENKLNNL